MPKVTYPRVSADPGVQAHYERCRANGCSPALAEMLAFRQPPGAKDDTTFVRGVSTPYGLPDNPVGRKLAAKLRKAGADPSGLYLSGLAKSTGGVVDPEAVVRSRDDIKRVCRKRGWGCEGTVNVSLNRDNLDPGKPIGLAPDILDRKVREAAAKDPSCVATPKKAAETRQKLYDKHKPHWVKD